ncbi:MAG: hypothetical protein V4525_00210 [Pseudomonadota bacterium]
MEFKKRLGFSNTIKMMISGLLLLPVVSSAATDPLVFSCGETPYYVRVGKTNQLIDLGLTRRTFDFGKTGGLISSYTGKNNPGVLIAGGQDGKVQDGTKIVLSASGITSRGIPGRIESTEKGLKIAIKTGDGPFNDAIRTQISSFALPTDQRLIWSLQAQFGSDVLEENWKLTRSGVDPTLIWQIKAPNLQPSLAAMVDTDDTDPTKLMLFFNIKPSSTGPIQRVGTIKGLLRHQPINIVMEAVLDEKTIANNGKGYWIVKVNDKPVVNYSGPTLVSIATEPHQWMVGLYQYLTYGPAPIPRVSYWNNMQLLKF